MIAKEMQRTMVERTQWFLLFFQTEGLCQALRLLIQADQSPGDATVALLKSMKKEAQLVGHGMAFDRLPEIEVGSSTPDMLVAAEVMRSTLLAFLSPEEVEDQRRAMGFPTS